MQLLYYIFSGYVGTYVYAVYQNSLASSAQIAT